MANINKSALLILSEEKTKFLMNRKSRDHVTSQWLMQGGSTKEGETIENSLVREIREERSCELDPSMLQYIGEYEAVVAGQPGKTVHSKLYSGSIGGVPVPTSEIVAFGWLGMEDRDDGEVSEIILSNIIPDLVQRAILRDI